MSISIRPGFDERHRGEVASLFWGAFQGKLSRSLGPDHKALDFITGALRPEFAFSALDGDGQLMGVAGIKTEKGGLVGGTFSDLRAVYGLWGAVWRGVLLEQFERPLADGVLQMDGIFVHPDARGRGIGGELLKAVIWTAEMNRYSQVRLDVIDSNPRARALYERMGFEASGELTTGVLAPLMGFKRATTMIYPVVPRSS